MKKLLDQEAMAKGKFLEITKVGNEQLAMRNAIQAALGRNPIYTTNASEENRRALRARTRQLLRNLSRQYHSPVDDNARVQNIRDISNVLSSGFAAILQGQRFRIGTLKALQSLSKISLVLGARSGASSALPDG